MDSLKPEFDNPTANKFHEFKSDPSFFADKRPAFLDVCQYVPRHTSNEEPSILTRSSLKSSINHTKVKNVIENIDLDEELDNLSRCSLEVSAEPHLIRCRQIGHDYLYDKRFDYITSSLTHVILNENNFIYIVKDFANRQWADLDMYSLFRLCRAYHALGEYESIVDMGEVIERSIEQSQQSGHKDMSTYFTCIYAAVMISEGSHLKAKSILNAHLCSENLSPLFEGSQCLVDQRYSDAIRNLMQLLQSFDHIGFERDPILMNWIGFAYSKSGNAKEALKWFEMAISISDSHHIVAIGNQAILLAKTCDLTNDGERRKRALELLKLTVTKLTPVQHLAAQSYAECVLRLDKFSKK